MASTRTAGTRLAQSPEQITIGRSPELSRMISRLWNACADNICATTDVCRLKLDLHQALSVYFKVLGTWTLVKLVIKPKAFEVR